MSFGYNLAGQKTSTTLPNGTTITHTYDRTGQLEEILSDWVDSAHPATLAHSFVYDSAARISSMDFGNGKRATRSYNSSGQLKTLQHGTSGSLTLEYDPNHNYFIRFFPEDVTNDGHNELVTEWTHGVYIETVIVSLGPKPRVIFQEAYRYGMFLTPLFGSVYKAQVKIVDGSGAATDITLTTYVWSERQQKFIVTNRETILERD